MTINNKSLTYNGSSIFAYLRRLFRPLDNPCRNDAYWNLVIFHTLCCSLIPSARLWNAAVRQRYSGLGDDCPALSVFACRDD